MFQPNKPLNPSSCDLQNLIMFLPAAMLDKMVVGHRAGFISNANDDKISCFGILLSF